MKLIATRHFTWTEPKELLRDVDRRERAATRWWQPAAFALGIVLMLLATWGLARITPNKQPPSFGVALGLAASAGIFFAYVLPLVRAKISSQIVFFDHGIMRVRLGHRLTKYEQLRTFSWRSSASGCATLILVDRAGREIWIGAPGSVTMDAVSDFLCTRGVQRAEASVTA